MLDNVSKHYLFPKGWYHIYSIEKFFGMFPFEVNLALFPIMYFQCPVWGTSVDLFKLFKLWLLLWWDHSPRHYPLTVSFPYVTQHASPRQYPERVWWAGVRRRSVRLAMNGSSCSAEYIAALHSSTTFYRRHKQVDQFLHYSMHPSWSARMFAGFRKLKLSIFGQRSFWGAGLVDVNRKQWINQICFLCLNLPITGRLARILLCRGGLSWNNLVFIVMKIFTWKGKIKNSFIDV